MENQNEAPKIKKTADKKAYFKKYYSENKEKYLNRPVKYAFCELCTCYVLNKNWGQHEQTKRHTRMLYLDYNI